MVGQSRTAAVSDFFVYIIFALPELGISLFFGRIKGIVITVRKEQDEGDD